MDSKMELDTAEFKDGITITECSICYINKVEITFLCKHSVCKSCYHNIELCPFCRKRIKPIPVIEPDTGEIMSNKNFYFVLCVMMIAPMIWVCFALGVILNSNI
jgi:hypothetical protein